MTRVVYDSSNSQVALGDANVLADAVVCLKQEHMYECTLDGVSSAASTERNSPMKRGTVHNKSVLLKIQAEQQSTIKHCHLDVLQCGV